jgi:hypothetical protein
VELSIVLVILGLLTGGILTGQNLIRAAELRSVATQFSSYQTAVFTFRDKYMGLPGDMTNATGFWGNADTGGTGGECAAPDTDTGTGTQTCNGNGDGRLSTSIYQNWEMFRAWQHLANAGMIEGSYTGISGSGGTRDAIIGVNVPAGKVPSSGFSFRHHSETGSHASFWPYQGNALYFGAKEGSNETLSPVIKPEEAWGIDKKLDDGRPAYGKIRSYKTGGTIAPGCTTSDLADVAEYSLDDSGTICSLFIALGI